ncbi:hypothetical protein LX97_02626 [Nonlabens dokdonensis]|uniref:Transmembrane protein n=1 Tax=Nonlabens dokdonensis TaxID=328515 RepID=A0ABX5PWU0_9FLAO|nr:hypothetical protein LX97_02626 [Nonlabens dokdonensis]
MINLNKISFVITIVIHIYIALSYKLLDNFNSIIFTYAISTLFGFLLKLFCSKNLKKIGWGIYYGSIVPLILLGVFMIWLYAYYPK